MKKYEQKANWSTISNFGEKTIILFSSYGFMGINFMINGHTKMGNDVTDNRFMILSGILLLGLGVLAIIDKRKDMRDTSYVAGIVFIYLISCVYLFEMAKEYWLIAVYVFEVAITCLCVYISYIRRTKIKTKKKKYKQFKRK